MLFLVRKGGHFRDVTIGEYFFSSFNFNYEIMACVLKNYFRNRLCTLFYLAYDIGLDFTYQLRRLYQSMGALRRHTLPYPLLLNRIFRILGCFHHLLDKILYDSRGFVLFQIVYHLVLQKHIN